VRQEHLVKNAASKYLQCTESELKLLEEEDLNGHSLTTWRAGRIMPPQITHVLEVGGRFIVPTQDLTAFQSFLMETRLDVTNLPVFVPIFERFFPPQRIVLITQRDAKRWVGAAWKTYWREPIRGDDYVELVCNDVRAGNVELLRISTSGKIGLTKLGPGKCFGRKS
jgi:hypothetical protein